MEDNLKSDQVSLSSKGKKQSRMSRHFVAPDATITELEKKAADCEQKVAKAEEPLAEELRREARLCREWVAALRSGRWTS